LRILVTFFLLLLLTQGTSALAEDIHVGIEPFPPAITNDRRGHAIDMFKAIEKISDLKFHFHVMNYARAKKELKNKKLNMIGMTPQGYETPSFYQYAQDLDWNLNVSVDLFSFDKKFFNIQKLPLHSIGTLRGNANFFSELLHIPREKFIEVTELSHLANMLKLGRLNVIVFERVSVILTFQELNIKNVYYQQFGTIPASFAVRKDDNGNKLKNKLDSLLQKIDSESFYEPYYKYKQLLKSGLLVGEQ
jgi:polar amino acid transport system substrate-binding protein